MSYGKFFSQLKNRFNNEWEAYVCHEFVKKLSSGDLEKEQFFNYLIQDYLFLIQFSKAWSLAIVKADNFDEMKLCANTVNGLINFEMNLHVKLCQSYGIPKDKLLNAEEDNRNIAYTRYVLETGYSGDFLDLLTSLIPCVMGYGEIGNSLKECRPNQEMYEKWIETYSSDEYQELCREVGILYDNSIELRLGKNFENAYKWKKLENIFKKATLLEVDFWGIASN